jgi:predicted O-methyltransferase YrrM
MKLVKPVLRVVRDRVVQPLALVLADVTALALKRLVGNPAHAVFDRHGFHLLRKSFYLPIPEVGDTHRPFWAELSELVGLEMGEPEALDYMERILPPFLEEFRELFPVHAAGDANQFHLINGNYMAVDAHVYYAFIRYFNPRRIVEIGSGNSTLVAAAACARNGLETGSAPNLTAIEPYPSARLRDGIPGLTRLIQSKVQDVGLSLFEELEAGDILFIDSSHALRQGGDVQFEYLEILPRLASGVLIHIHDISLPKPYPPVYFDTQIYWNEQYLLQAFLAFNREFRVIWPGNYLWLRHPTVIKRHFPEIDAMREAFPQSEPSAFWIQRV